MKTRSYTAVLAATGVLMMTACQSDHEDRDKNEVPVTMDALPSAVRTTLDRESAGGKVTEVEKEVKKGKTTYSADVTINGQGWDIDIAEDGTILSKKKEKAGEK
jgi:uncharacterized membrane protein YkoI